LCVKVQQGGFKHLAVLGFLGGSKLLNYSGARQEQSLALTLAS
jgi:hypothetical protein